MKKNYLFVLLIIILAGGAVFVYTKNKPTSNNSSTSTNNTSVAQTKTPTPASTLSAIQNPTNPNGIDFPVADFSSRITKKPFGIHITPSTSPVQPEKFIGYHTGTDIEYQDVSTDVPVYAVADGTVVLSKKASGYGGVFMISIDINGTRHTVVYGHIRPSSLPKVGTQVKKGEQLAVLGTGYSSETDGERRHLHFAVLSDNRKDIRGYVSSKSRLSGWLDPVSLY